MTEENRTQCPVCGSFDVKISDESRSYLAPFGVPSSFRAEIATCRACGESGDFRNVNAAAIKDAIESADQKSLVPIFEALSESGFSMAYIERALRLPTRTAARWKAGECSASGIALLRLIRTYPWLLDVAASGFADSVARRAVVTAAGSLLAQAVEAAGFRYSVSSVSASQPEHDSVEITATLAVKPKLGLESKGVGDFVPIPALAA